MEIVFGHEVKSIDDVFLQVASKGGRTIAAAGAIGAHIVDLIPPCTFPTLSCRQRFYMNCLFLKCASSPTGFPELDLNGSPLVLGKLSLQCAMSHLTTSKEGWSVLAASSV